MSSGLTLSETNLHVDVEEALTREELLAYRNTPRPAQQRLMADIERAWYWLARGGHVVNRVELAGLHEVDLTEIYKHESRRVRALAESWKVWW
jgi:hypothetical protein